MARNSFYTLNHTLWSRIEFQWFLDHNNFNIYKYILFLMTKIRDKEMINNEAILKWNKNS